jgi:hypothetical protein
VPIGNLVPDSVPVDNDEVCWVHCRTIVSLHACISAVQAPERKPAAAVHTPQLLLQPWPAACRSQESLTDAHACGLAWMLLAVVWVILQRPDDDTLNSRINHRIPHTGACRQPVVPDGPCTLRTTRIWALVLTPLRPCSISVANTPLHIASLQPCCL